VRNIKPPVRIPGSRSQSFKQSHPYFVAHLFRYLDSSSPHFTAFSLLWLSLDVKVIIQITFLNMREDHALQELNIALTKRFTDQDLYTVSGAYISPRRA
jgi:hypothetical protein